MRNLCQDSGETIRLEPRAQVCAGRQGGQASASVTGGCPRSHSSHAHRLGAVLGVPGRRQRWKREATRVIFFRDFERLAVATHKKLGRLGALASAWEPAMKPNRLENRIAQVLLHAASDGGARCAARFFQYEVPAKREGNNMLVR